MAIDLTQATTAAAKTMFETLGASGAKWDELSPNVRYQFRTHVLDIVVAASKDIARQAWAEGYLQADNGEDEKNPYEDEETTAW